jgi:hypothetical protein
MSTLSHSKGLDCRPDLTFSAAGSSSAFRQCLAAAAARQLPDDRADRALRRAAEAFALRSRANDHHQHADSAERSTWSFRATIIRRWSRCCRRQRQDAVVKA